MKNLMLAFTVLLATIALVAAPALADEPDPGAAPVPFTVVRLGDNQMSCEALITEINDLNGQIQTAQTAMTQRTSEMTRNAMRQSRGGGMAQSAGMTLGGLAASFIPGGALVASAAQMAASTAAQAAAQAQQERQMAEMEAMTADISNNANAMIPLSERVQHLSEIARNKTC